MKLEVPLCLQIEQEHVRARLGEAGRTPGRTGEAARALARLLETHVARENQFALPPLFLLVPLAEGKVAPEMEDVLVLTDRLRRERCRLDREHTAIVAALRTFLGVATREGHEVHARLAEDLLRHIRLEDDVLYPAAMLAGALVRRLLREGEGEGKGKRRRKGKRAGGDGESRSGLEGSRALPRWSVGRYMTAAPYAIEPERKLVEAHRLMRDHRIRHLPVVDGVRLVGLLSMGDLHLLETLEPVDPEEVPVRDAMSPDPYAVPPEAPLTEVARVMAEYKYGSAVVLSAGEVRGIFTTIDALRALTELLMTPVYAAAGAERAATGALAGAARP